MTALGLISGGICWTLYYETREKDRRKSEEDRRREEYRRRREEDRAMQQINDLIDRFKEQGMRL